MDLRLWWSTKQSMVAYIELKTYSNVKNKPKKPKRNGLKNGGIEKYDKKKPTRTIEQGNCSQSSLNNNAIRASV